MFEISNCDAILKIKHMQMEGKILCSKNLMQEKLVFL